MKILILILLLAGCSNPCDVAPEIKYFPKEEIQHKEGLNSGWFYGEFVTERERLNLAVDPTRAVIHHTATSRDMTVEEIRTYHVDVRGWDDIGYHFYINKEGIIYKARPLTKKGAHAKGRNHLVGICLSGYSSFTPQQIDALRVLLKALRTKHIEPHHEKCPGKGFDFELENSLLDKENI